MKNVRESKAAGAVSAWVVLKDGQLVATVQASHTQAVRVDVWDERTHELSFQGRASGYGYDKLTAAMSGAVIGGVRIYDHSVTCPEGWEEYNDEAHNDEKTDAIRKKYGCEFANWSRETGKYQSCYYVVGLDRLKVLGFMVVKAI